jgi:hypothetical protein
MAFPRLFDAADLHQVDADADDHKASELYNMLTPMTFTTPQKAFTAKTHRTRRKPTASYPSILTHWRPSRLRGSTAYQSVEI